MLRAALEQALIQYGDRTAVRSGEESYSYADLNTAHIEARMLLRQAKVQPGHLLAIHLPKSFATLAWILAAWAEEIVFIPLDVHQPLARKIHIMEQAKPHFLVSSADPTTPLVFDPAQRMRVYPYSAGPASLPDNTAFVLFTSGSTGYPKGVKISEQNVWSFCNWAADQFNISLDDVVASVAPFHFDLSTFDIYTTLSRGACLVLFNSAQVRNPRYLAMHLAAYSVTCLYATPSLLQLMVRHGKLDRYNGGALRLVLFAGEVFPTENLRQLQSFWPQAQYYNLYGPTETNVVTWQAVPVPAERETPYPIGNCCPFAEALLAADNGYEFPQAHAQGELLISGNSVSSGYLNDDEKTAQAYVQYQGKRWYRTGDLVSVGKDGKSLIYQGRADRMVKRNGYRIELAEVERAYRRMPGLREVAAVAFPVDGANRIVLWAIPAMQPYKAPDKVTWHEYGTRFIPHYMLPDQLLMIEAWPYTSSQKLDYQQLIEKAREHA